MKENVRREDWKELKPTVYDWGINDVNYKVQIKENLGPKGRRQRRKLLWICPYYNDWKSMLLRCKSSEFKERGITYKDCTICEEWQYLSNFIRWVDSQPNKDWQNCELDKDILFVGNKIYSPDTAIYVPSRVNTFLIDTGRSRGNLMIGVSHEASSKKNPFRAQCSNHSESNHDRGYIGLFPTELEAHKAWQAKKHELACELANLQDDPRVADALRQRYSPDKDWTKV